MRLSPRQAAIIRQAARDTFGPDARVWLFGSRVDDGMRGGDYDFYLETSLADPDAIIARKLALLATLHANSVFADEKIDVVIRPNIPGPELPIYQVAKREGLPL